MGFTTRAPILTIHSLAQTCPQGATTWAPSMLGNQCPTFEVPVTLHQGATLQQVGAPRVVVNVDSATAA